MYRGRCVINIVVLKGRIGRDPETTYTPGGVAICKFSMAVPDRFHPKDKTKTIWPRIIAWQKLAEVIQQYCKKGQEIAIQGRLTSSTYEKNGVKITSWEVVAETMEFCGPPPSTSSAAPEDDLPF